MSSQDLSPQSNASDLDGSKEGGRVFGVTCSNAAPSLEVKKRIFDQVSQLVECSIILALHLTVLCGRDNHFHVLLNRLFKDGIRESKHGQQIRLVH